jgi:glycosyltransferase involved in cell wall biosynthesis
MGIPDGAFVVGMVANNTGTHPPRKAFPQVLQAFANLRRQHDDVFLYLHTELTGTNEGMNLIEHMSQLGVPRAAIGFCSQMHLFMGAIAADDMARMYSAFDVLANPSYGEGFGIPIIEAQACGTPVIVSEWTAMPELCGSGWRIGGEPYYDAGQGSFYLAPSVAQITEAMEDAYQSARGMRDKARRFALAYDADTVFEDYWQPILDQLAAKVGGAREVAALA